ncbi:hypothetical protein [Nonomuraea diastatica]|uniref:hypothetical protein n=1 Tax=Nonomuraea diastatica TaxID=1848329 RepID=UPI001C701691|nr:hypothetical protein [Nonomuraea diastatica]
MHKGTARPRPTTWKDWTTDPEACRELVAADNLTTDGQLLDLGVAVVEVRRFRPVYLQRQTNQVPAEAEDIVQLVVPIHGTVSATWAGRQDTASVGDLYAHDLARLEDVSLQSDGQDALELALVAIPKSVLPLQGEAMASLLGQVCPSMVE